MKTNWIAVGTIATLIALLPWASPTASAKPPSRKDALSSPEQYEAYRKVVEDTCAMVSNDTARRLAQKYELQILNVTWEDTGRFKGSAVGPNITDMTLQVQLMDPRTEKFQLFCMPVIRYPNFSDKTADLSPEKFYVLVGNQKGKDLRKISLKELLGNPRKYLSKPDSWKGTRKSLLADRDTHVLVSAQACFLPIPKGGEATFNPVVFNYQSYEGDPAVLTILATREGTSMTVIDNQRDAFQAGPTWGQRIFFNQNGERTGLTGKRMSDFLAEKKEEGSKGGSKGPEAAGNEGLNMVLLIQVPLKQKKPMTYEGDECTVKKGGKATRGKDEISDIEEAVIGHGKVEGPFTEIDNLEIERDPAYPVRVTVQFYKATSNGAVSAADLADINKQIARVYAEADYVGSLVVDGPTGRPTEHNGPKFEPPDWWEQFWKRHQQNTGMTPEETIRMLRKLYGPNYTPKNEAELERELKRLAPRKAGEQE
jgi:hypothetical protein